MKLLVFIFLVFYGLSSMVNILNPFRISSLTLFVASILTVYYFSSIYTDTFSDNEIMERKFHYLRHTFATRLFKLEEEPKTVQALLGHSNISVTLDTYTRVLEGMKEKAASKSSDLLYSYMGVNFYLWIN